jgi:hypothetical protein
MKYLKNALKLQTKFGNKFKYLLSILARFADYYQNTISKKIKHY